MHRPFYLIYTTWRTSLSTEQALSTCLDNASNATEEARDKYKVEPPDQRENNLSKFFQKTEYLEVHSIIEQTFVTRKSTRLPRLTISVMILGMVKLYFAIVHAQAILPTHHTH